MCFFSSIHSIFPYLSLSRPAIAAPAAIAVAIAAAAVRVHGAFAMVLLACSVALGVFVSAKTAKAVSLLAQALDGTVLLQVESCTSYKRAFTEQHACTGNQSIFDIRFAYSQLLCSTSVVVAEHLTTLPMLLFSIALFCCSKARHLICNRWCGPQNLTRF
jgi:hypothetical protein